MDELFSLYVHHGGHFIDIENGRKYVGGAVDFGYTSVSKLWYKMPGVDQELADFHLIVDDSDAMYLT